MGFDNFDNNYHFKHNAKHLDKELKYLPLNYTMDISPTDFMLPSADGGIQKQGLEPWKLGQPTSPM